MKQSVIDDSNPIRADGGAPTLAQRRRLEMDALRDLIAIFEEERRHPEESPFKDASCSAILECLERLRKLYAEEAADPDVIEEELQKY